jgi:subtilisin family serine protease
MQLSINKIKRYKIIFLIQLGFICPTFADQCVSQTPVAVIDTGIDSTHPMIINHLWHDPKIKDMYGWNFVPEKQDQSVSDSTNAVPTDEAYNEEISSVKTEIESDGKMNPIDIHGHGTHVAGIIIKQDPCVQIMSIKYYATDLTYDESVDYSLKALKFAIKHKAKIINYSGGGPVFLEAEYNLLKKAEKAGILVISAAGNEHHNIDPSKISDLNAYYPAYYHLSNMISVASVDQDGKLADSSNWGKKYVHLAALGVDIVSSVPNKRYASMTGTSQATAQVSGIASAIWSKNPSLTAQQVKKIILKSVITESSLKGKVVTGGIADLDQSLENTPIWKKAKHAVRKVSSN